MDNKEFINHVCKSTGMSKKELAEKLGISQGHLGNMSSKIPMSKTIKNFCDYLIETKSKRIKKKRPNKK